MGTTAITYTRTPDVQTIDPRMTQFDPIVIDFTGLPLEQRGGPAKTFLAASAMCCYCSALGSAIVARKGSYESIGGTATVVVGPDDLGRDRVRQITLDVEVKLPEAYKDILERCLKIMENGCLVTASLEPCIKMIYNVKTVFTD